MNNSGTMHTLAFKKDDDTQKIAVFEVINLIQYFSLSMEYMRAEILN